MNIVLIGYRCSGKTTAGKILARDMGRKFRDTDLLIEEKTNLLIHSYVLQNGWEQFRKLEKEIVRELAMKDDLVIATGGGVVMDQDNLRNLKRKGRLVWLKAEAAVIKERMERQVEGIETRPSLSDGDPLEEIDGILGKRTESYIRASDYVVCTNERSPDEVARAVVEALRGTLKPKD